MPNTIPIPQGATVGIPEGATIGEPGATPGAGDISGIEGRKISGGQKWAEQHPDAMSVITAPAHLVEGVGQGVADTAQGLKSLVNKALPSGAQIPDVPGRTMPGEQENIPQKVGKLAEAGAEWAAGDEALSAAGKALEIAQRFPGLVALMEKYPKWGSIIMKTIKGAAIGGAQGGVKGAATGQGKEGAEAGAIGGAIGGGLSEAAFGGGRVVMNKLFGATPEEAFTMAARPYVKDVNFEEAATRAIPRIEAAVKNHPFKNVGEFVDLLDEEKGNIWQKEYQPLIAQHPNDVVNGAPIARAIRARKTMAMAAMPSIFKGETAEIESIAQDFDNFQLKVPEASEVLKSLNAKLSDYYRMSAADRAGARITDGYLTGLEAAADEIRDQIDAKLGPQAGELRKDYGAMKDLHRIFARRAMVYNRQAPINLPQVLGGIEATAALLSGHPLAALAGAVPFAQRWANSPGTLIKRGLSLASGPTAIGAAARDAIPAVAAFGSSQAGQATATNGGGDDVAP